MSEGTFYLNSEYKYEIGDSLENMKVLGAGISSVDPDGNEEVDQTAYLDGDGGGSSDVTGGQPVFSFDGHRVNGDPAQDYIFGKRYTYGSGRRCQFKITEPDGTVVKGSATIASITGPGGDANTKGEIGFELHFNGKPTVEEPT